MSLLIAGRAILRRCYDKYRARTRASLPHHGMLKYLPLRCISTKRGILLGRMVWALAKSAGARSNVASGDGRRGDGSEDYYQIWLQTH